MAWDAVDIDAPLGTLAPSNLAIVGTDPVGRRTVVVAKLGKARRGRVRVDYMDAATRDAIPPVPNRVRVPAHVSLSEFAMAFPQVKASSAGTVPKVVGLNTPMPTWGTILMVLIGAAVVVLGGLLNMPVIVMNGVLVLIIGTLTRGLRHGPGAAKVRTSTPPRVLDNGRDVLPSEIAERFSTPSPAGPTPTDRANLVKDAYATLLSDIVYRIENSALFDNAVAQTQRFQLALLAWDAASPDAASLADELTDAFAAARTHAESLGIDHLPHTARDTGRRAASAAATALATDHEGERRAAALKAASLLSSLALYYLPTIDPDTPSLVGQRKQIEPR